MFPPNLGARSAEFPPILYVTTDEDGPVQFTVSYMKGNPRVSGMTTHTATKNKLTRVELPFEMKDTFTGFTVDGGIILKAEEGKNIIVYALNEDGASTDVYLGFILRQRLKHTITMVPVFLAVVLNQRPLMDTWPLLYRKLTQS